MKLKMYICLSKSEYPILIVKQCLPQPLLTDIIFQEGIRPGQQLLSISDPIRNDESWNISLQTKLSRVRDALQFRTPPTIYLQLTQSSIEDEAGFEWRYTQLLCSARHVMLTSMQVAASTCECP